MWGLDSDVSPKIVDVVLCGLRKKLAGTRLSISSEWGVGPAVVVGKPDRNPTTQPIHGGIAA